MGNCSISPTAFQRLDKDVNRFFHSCSPLTLLGSVAVEVPKFSLSLAVRWYWNCWYWWLIILYRFKIKVLLKAFLSWFIVCLTHRTVVWSCYLLWIYWLRLTIFFLALVLLTGCIYTSTTYKSILLAYMSSPCQCYRCCSFHSNGNSGKETLLFYSSSYLQTENQPASVSRQHFPSAANRTTPHRSPDQLLVVVQSLPGHVVDEGGVLHFQLPRDGQEERGGVQDVHLHFCLPLGCVLLVLTLWRHLGIKEVGVFLRALFFSCTVAAAVPITL